jgi:hypothetical protein
MTYLDSHIGVCSVVKLVGRQTMNLDKWAIALSKPLQLIPTYHRWERALEIEPERLSRLSLAVLTLPRNLN